MAANSASVRVEGRSVKVTNLDKVMYPATGTTKGDVIGYYQAVAPWLVPHLAGRPVTRKRWVHGVGTAKDPAKPFFHKNSDDRSTPEWVLRRTIEHKDDDASYPLVNDTATLVWLAQLAALELHVPQWRFDDDGARLNPDRLVLDLDPGEGAGLDECVELAHLIKEVLDGIGFVSVPVTSGSKGIHLYAGLDGHLTCAEASELAHELARSLESLRPDLVVSDMKKELRGGKVLLDWSQNNGNKTTISPYSLRGRERPTVAAPRRWDEIEPGLTQLDFHEALRRLESLGDPLAVLLPDAEDASASPDRLATYRSMRDAAITPEPVPDAPPTPGDGNSFVIQEHHASRLHYDFRLEHDGVLVSWAVPKGPPLEAGTNRLAVQTEDHPLEYGSFEGTIPSGEYGGGTVTIWDAGTIEVEKWRDGREVIATLTGRPGGGLGGVPRRYALIHTAHGDAEKNWLLHLMEPAEDTAEASEPEHLPVIEPMLATPATAADVTGDDWHFEVKWDGYRAIATVGGGAVSWRSRGGIDLSANYPELAELGPLLAGREAVLDGEIVVLDDQGRSRFELLQNHGTGAHAAHYMMFDLLFLDGRSYVRRPYVERRAALEELVGDGGEHVHVPTTFGTDRDTALAASRQLQLEGVVAKRADSVYLPGRRGSAWLKIKNVRTQEVVVVGWAPGKGGRSATLGGLLLAVNGEDGLSYVGRVGSGFSDKALVEARTMLDARAIDAAPLDGVPRADAKDARWVTPELVGEVTFSEWTSTGRLRQPVWRGWRPDKVAGDVAREEVPEG
ncbi:ATP-dependent DNA ligase [Nigerium massiliense]|uniref:ATP-dependent DNA ligase n=1 Tax=Nigerium massiliense TaxID=1522317 RepID=UPI00058E6FEF|nr:ATP-dependent DNA ligase [Nigerium massiliense]